MSDRAANLGGLGARLVAALVAAVTSARAFNLSGTALPDGNTVINLQLGAPSAPLADGATDWNTVAESALNEWNTQLGRSKFTANRDTTAAVAANNRVNNVTFRSDIYGASQFGANTLAVTLTRNTDRDVLFNANKTWDSYRGPSRPGTADFRRVALHEFGHVLGLDHPDQAEPFQNVAAIMESTSGNVESLRTDDINGIKFLYDAAPPTVVPVMGSFTLTAPAAGAGPFTYTWYFRATGSNRPEFFRLATEGSYTIGSVQTADAGTYAVMARNPAGVIFTNVATLAPLPGETNLSTRLANISTRGVVGTGNDVLIAGLVVGGTAQKSVLLRATGPALAEFGVGGALADPTLVLLDAQNRAVAQNDNWETGGDAASIIAASARLGAFPLKSGSRDAALLTSLSPGNYTAIVSGVSNTNGVALVEAYDADPSGSPAETRRLVNIATRGQVGTGEANLIAGLVVAGPGPRTFLFRAIGPTLARAPFNVTGALLDPFLQIYQGERLLHENDDWDTPASAMSPLRDASARVGAFAMQETRTTRPPSGLDAALILTLQPGSYTAKVSGFAGATGVALVEIYELP